MALEKAFCYRDGLQIAGNTSFPITYDDDLLKKLQLEIVDMVLPYISVPRGRDLSSKDLNEYMQGLSVSYSIAALRLALFFKHLAYRHEEEYRFMQIQRGDRPAENVKCRLRPYSLVRFVEFDWRTLAPMSLKEIVVGPAANKHQATTFADDCLKAYQNATRTNIRIRSSDIPYRGARYS